MDSDLCAHGCMRMPSVEHADGRALCRSCYDAEVGGHPFLPCPVCDPRDQFAPVAYWTDAVLVEKVARGLYEVMGLDQFIDYAEATESGREAFRFKARRVLGEPS